MRLRFVHRGAGQDHFGSRWRRQGQSSQFVLEDVKQLLLVLLLDPPGCVGDRLTFDLCVVQPELLAGGQTGTERDKNKRRHLGGGAFDRLQPLEVGLAAIGSTHEVYGHRHAFCQVRPSFEMSSFPG